jgi:chromosome segregation ATPase
MSPSRREPATLEGRVQRLEASVDRLHDDYQSIRESLRSMSEQLADLVRLSERQATQRDGLERAFDALARLESQVAVIENRVATLDVKSQLVGHAGSSIVGIAVRVIATGIVAAVATIIALWASRGAA